MVNELALWAEWVLGRAWIWKKHASSFLGGARFGTGRPIVIERPERCLSRDELARSVNQDVMLTFVVRDETEPVNVGWRCTQIVEQWTGSTMSGFSEMARGSVRRRCVAVPAVLAAVGESSMRRACRVKAISLSSGRVSATRIHTRAARLWERWQAMERERRWAIWAASYSLVTGVRARHQAHWDMLRGGGERAEIRDKNGRAGEHGEPRDTAERVGVADGECITPPKPHHSPWPSIALTPSMLSCLTARFMSRPVACDCRKGRPPQRLHANIGHGTDSSKAASMPNALRPRTEAVAVCEMQHVERGTLCSPRSLFQKLFTGQRSL
ncbi:hypothetical protein SVAN01_00363 [Stagonosporopsis vannaccii]|nr:hypothetical protein SVAN01_00363 [Stagonosporopsis vannaccii]